MWTSPSRILLSVSTLLFAVAQPTTSADVTFQSVRNEVVKDYTGQGGDIPNKKYFRESSFHYHYDGRFANETLPPEETIPHLSELIRTYLSTMADLGAETWIMHGTMLAWWWNQKIFPWDNDIDVQVTEPTIRFLDQYYNMTEHHFDIPGVEGGRSYLLEINPFYVIRSTNDKANVIDARWIDMSSGLFIDITAVRKDDAAVEKGDVTALMCKDGHRFDENEIFPLRNSHFEDFPVKIPYDYTKLLVEEYGNKALTVTNFQGHTFNEETLVWDKNEEKKSKRDSVPPRKAGMPVRTSPLGPRLR